jgi:hypothetical protein
MNQNIIVFPNDTVLWPLLMKVSPLNMVPRRFAASICATNLRAGELAPFRESEILRHIFERVVAECIAAGHVKGEGFAVDASVMEANASRYHGKAPV